MRQVEGVNSSLFEIWASLRKKEYEDHKLEIRERVESLGKEKLFVENEDQWNKYIRSIEERLENLIENKNRNTDLLYRSPSQESGLQIKIEAEETMLRKHEREIDRVLRDTRTLTDIIDGLEKLQEFLTIADTGFRRGQTDGEIRGCIF